MMRSLYSAVSGLKSHQTRMDVIGNNIANINTTGFKGSRATFQSMLTQNLSSASAPTATRGGTDAKQVGLGTSVASIDKIMTDGSVQSTGVNTDLCISGNGFFILQDGDQTYYSRNGAFEFDTDGNYILPGSGLKVQGWIADSKGVINTGDAVSNIVVPSGQTMQPTATTSATFGKNLSADGTADKVTTVVTATTADTTHTSADNTTTKSVGTNGQQITVVNTYDGTNKTEVTTTVYPSSKAYKTATSNTTVAVGTNNVTEIATPTSISAQITSYDSEGAQHLINTVFTKTDTNEWSMSSSVTSDDGYTYKSGETVNGIANAVYTLSFNKDGSLNEIKDSTGAVVTEPKFSYGTKQANQVNVALTMSSLTQYSGDSTATVTASDGYTAGSLQSVSFDSTGTLIGTFSNNQKKSLAQVAMATFNNPNGLEEAGSTLYTQSKNSGLAQVSTAGTNGAGALTASSLEMSNVNLSDQFSDMIVTQRGFQSNSKIITISDEMLETVVNMKR